VQAYVGSSGFSYDFWRGSFYPEDLPADGMLGYYAASCRAVEINNTFYRMPKADVMRRWADVVPGHFRFAIKASRRITHMARLKDAGDNVAYLFKQLDPLGDKRGPVLYQCPPNLKKDAELLRAFLRVLPAGSAPVLEFRHASWLDEEVYDILRENGACLCGSDEDDPDPPLVRTSDHGYLRLRAEDYDEAVLARWIERARALWPTVFVFFKHEESAPTLIERAHALFAVPSADHPPATDVRG
jgi:uncharacterized protein YecE (DUF72 family)